MLLKSLGEPLPPQFVRKSASLQRMTLRRMQKHS